jgi:hypothetical protein
MQQQRREHMTKDDLIAIANYLINLLKQYEGHDAPWKLGARNLVKDIREGKFTGGRALVVPDEKGDTLGLGRLRILYKNAQEEKLTPILDVCRSLPGFDELCKLIQRV